MSVHNILLVEDDVAFARFLIGSFRDVDPTLEIFHINGGHAAVSVVNAGFRPDIVICEDHIPRMSGCELLTNLRADPSFQTVPFYILTSSFADEAHGAECMLPIDVKLPRPSTYREALVLVGRVRSLDPRESHTVPEGQAATI